MNDPREITAEIHRFRRRVTDDLFSTGYSPTVAAKIMVTETLRAVIEPTPTTELGPIVISVADTANGRIHGRELLAHIAHQVDMAFDDTAVTYRSDTVAEIAWR